MSDAIGAWSERELVSVTGPDAESFLQGQLSQDVATLGVGGSRWSLLLEPSGRMVARLRVHRTGDESFVLDVTAGWGGVVRSRLDRFRLRVACELGEPRVARTLLVRGVLDPPQSGHGTRLRGVAGTPSIASTGGEPVGLVGFDLVDLEASAEFAPPDGLRVDPDRVEALRVAAGVPEMDSEIDDSVIPAELGPWLVEQSVSWTKGCYTGQELVARVDSRGGNVPRRLRRLRVGTVPVTAGTPVFTLDGIEAGRVTSVAGGVALGLLGRRVGHDDQVTVIGSIVPVEAIEPITVVSDADGVTPGIDGPGRAPEGR
ncbi:MAG: hypothetical protein R2698_09795 [Microthrixaceae bacterium]